MIYNFLPVAVSLIFELILWNVFLSKKRLKTIRESYLTIYMILTTILCAFELVIFVTLKSTDSILINKIFYKLHFILLLITMYGIECYFLFVINRFYDRPISKSIFANLNTTFAFITKVIGIIILLFLPYETFDLENLNFTTGINFTVYTIIAVITFINILTVFTSKKYKNSMSDVERSGTALAILLYVILVILQLLIPHLLIVSSAFAIVTFALFVNSENPDLRYMEVILKNKEEIELSNKTKNNFLSNMTDEINVPLGLINSLCKELFVSGNYNKESYKEVLSKIKLSSNMLLESVNNILNISEIESGNKKLYNKNYNTEDLINDLVSLAKLKIGNKPINFTINIDSKIPSVLKGDISKLYLSISNVIINAAKYTETGKINFSVESKIDKNVVDLLFKVSDTGVGIKEGVDIFKKDKEEGGIGLSVAKEYIESMGGKLWYDSDYMVGSTFYVSIKQVVINQEAISEIENIDDKKITSLRDCSNLKAMIVDDSEISAKLMSRFLKKYNMQIECVYSGKECINKIKLEEKFDVIFVDLTMPDLDGLTVIKILRSLEYYQIPKVVALTANAMIGMRETCLQAGFDDYLSKPIDLKELDKIINKI